MTGEQRKPSPAPIPVAHTVREAANAFHVGEYTVREWIKAKKCAAFRIGRMWLIPAEEIARLVEAGQSSANNETAA